MARAVEHCLRDMPVGRDIVDHKNRESCIARPLTLRLGFP